MLFMNTCMNGVEPAWGNSLIRGDTSNLTIDHCETRYRPIIWVIPYLLLGQHVVKLDLKCFKGK